MAETFVYHRLRKGAEAGTASQNRGRARI